MNFGLLQGIWTIIVLIAFIAIVAWAWSSKRKKDFDKAARIPFQDGNDEDERQD